MLKAIIFYFAIVKRVSIFRWPKKNSNRFFKNSELSEYTGSSNVCGFSNVWHWLRVSAIKTCLGFLVKNILKGNPLYAYNFFLYTPFNAFCAQIFYFAIVKRVSIFRWPKKNSNRFLKKLGVKWMHRFFKCMRFFKCVTLALGIRNQNLFRFSC